MKLQTLVATLMGLLMPMLLEAQDAETILNRARGKLVTLDDLSATFKKELELPTMDQTRSYEGSLKMKGHQFHIDLNDQEVICDGKSLWRINKTNEEVTIKSYDPDEGLTPTRLFQLSQTDMKTRLMGTERIAGEATHRLELVPKKEDSQFTKIILWVNTNSYLPAKVRTSYRNGSTIIYTIKSIERNTGLADSNFEFDKQNYADYYIEDIR
jgi:outer membrane lipoprotein-sorting protein